MIKIAYKPHFCLSKLILLWLVMIFGYMSSAENKLPSITKHYLFKNYYCYIADTSNKRLFLVKKNIFTNKENNIKLPCQSVVKFNNKIIKVNQLFRWSFDIGETSYILYPDTWADATGSINIFLLTDSEISDKKNTTVTGERTRLNYLRSSEFFLTARPKKTISYIRDYMWCNLLFLSGKAYIISRVKLEKNVDASTSKFHYKWEIRKHQGMKFTSVATVNISKDFLPVEAMWFPDKFEVLTDTDTPFNISPNIAFYIWGQSKSTGKAQLAEFRLSKDGKVYNGKIKSLKTVPNSILYNKDSKYVMLLYNKYKGNMLIKFLKKRNLLKKYKTQLKHDSAQSSLKSKINISKLLPESSQKKSESSKNTAEWRKKHMSREEWRRIKGVSRSLEKLFTKSELEKLFKPVDYKSIKDKYELAQAYDRQGNFIAAFKVLKKMSNSRNLPAKLLLANYLQKGRKGIKNNPTEARKVYQKIIAAVQSKSAMPTAQEYYLLGLSLKETNPKPKTSTESIKAFEIAANSNYAPAFCRLGECYWEGYSIRQNMKKGKELLTKAAKQGSPRAKAILSSLYLSSNNTQKGLPLLKESVIAGDEIGQYCLGIAYLMGAGLKKNKNKAKFWLQKSADQGCIKAINLLKKKFK